MTREERLKLVINEIGVDIKALNDKKGDLSSLSTNKKTSLVDAINELFLLANAPKGVQIDDSLGNGATTTTWSSDKIFDTLVSLKQEVKDDIIGGAGAAFDTLAELKNALGSDESFSTTVATQLNNRIRFDQSQTLTQAQKTQACVNIGIGNPDVDLLAHYNTSKTT